MQKKKVLAIRRKMRRAANNVLRDWACAYFRDQGKQMGNSLNQSQSDKDADRKALRRAVKHRAKVKLVRYRKGEPGRIAKPVSAATRRGR